MLQGKDDYFFSLQNDDNVDDEEEEKVCDVNIFYFDGSSWAMLPCKDVVDGYYY